jgi:hypothetical protein
MDGEEMTKIAKLLKERRNPKHRQSKVFDFGIYQQNELFTYNLTFFLRFG